MAFPYWNHGYPPPPTQEKIDLAKAKAASRAADTATYRCYTCGGVYQGDNRPERCVRDVAPLDCGFDI